MNPLAIILWAILFLFGFLVWGVKVGLWFLLGGMCISLLISLLK